MKHLSLFLVLIASHFFLMGQPTECKNQVAFGDISICLAEVPGLIECYSDPIVEEYSNMFRAQGNTILGMYFTEDTYSRRDSLGLFEFDDYCKVYSVDELKGLPIGTNELDFMQEMMANNYLAKNWEEIQEEMEKEIDFFTVDQPVLLDTYEPHEKIRTSILLMQYNAEYYTKVLAVTINIMEVKGRMIYYSYYLNFDGEASLEQLRKKSDAFGLRLIEVN